MQCERERLLVGRASWGLRLPLLLHTQGIEMQLAMGNSHKTGESEEGKASPEFSESGLEPRIHVRPFLLFPVVSTLWVCCLIACQPAGFLVLNSSENSGV